MYVKTLGTVNSLETQFRALWTECQRCQGSLQHDVICTRSAPCLPHVLLAAWDTQLTAGLWLISFCWPRRFH